MTVSVCMIVKNEEALLARALDCLKDFADEIVIADTGSTDGTKSVARGYTEKIYDFKWCGDFSAARNFAFSKCTMDYIYSADADEIIDETNREKLKLLIASLNDGVDVVQMRYHNEPDNGSVYNFETELRPKLFRRLRSFRWVDPIHETIDTQLHVLDSGVTILHRPEKKHANRDFGIFERHAHPGCALSPRLHRLYAQELFLSGSDEDFLRAFPYFEWTLHEDSLMPDTVKQSQCVAARCCRLRGDEFGLMKTALKNVIGKPSAEVCCELGNYYFEKCDYEEAAIWFYTAAFGAECELDVRAGGRIPLGKLSECYALLGCYDEAKKYKKMAGEWTPAQ